MFFECDPIWKTTVLRRNEEKIGKYVGKPMWYLTVNKDDGVS